MRTRPRATPPTAASRRRVAPDLRIRVRLDVVAAAPIVLRADRLELRAETKVDGVVSALRAPIVAGACG